MAKRIIIDTVDNLDGSNGAQPYTFALNGVVYDIDLTPENAERLDAALEPFIKHARTSDAVRLMRVTKLSRSGKTLNS